MPRPVGFHRLRRHVLALDTVCVSASRVVLRCSIELSVLKSCGVKGIRLPRASLWVFPRPGSTYASQSGLHRRFVERLVRFESRSWFSQMQGCAAGTAGKWRLGRKCLADDTSNSWNSWTPISGFLHGDVQSMPSGRHLGAWSRRSAMHIQRDEAKDYAIIPNMRVSKTVTEVRANGRAQIQIGQEQALFRSERRHCCAPAHTPSRAETPSTSSLDPRPS